MSLSLSNIKRWYLMLMGKSIYHVNQSIGEVFNQNEIRGYYNNMIEKVTKAPELLEGEQLPQLEVSKGQMVYFPVAIFQYGLGAYDLYIKNKNELYLRKFTQCVNWALKHQEKTGAWSNFFYIYPDHPYGAMAQGEGASLLIRAYMQTAEDKYLEAAKKAIDFMLLPIEKGGTTDYSNDGVILLEYPQRQAVMNGWIFAWWGLYDYVLVTKDKGQYKALLDKSCSTLINLLPMFRETYWSKYDLSGRIASPFYHNLHVAQMEAMYVLTGDDVFNQYASRWKSQQHNPFCKSIAFVIKAVQKLKE